MQGKENGNEGSPARPANQCPNHAHVGAQDPRENDAAIPAIPAVVATSATSATALTLDDPVGRLLREALRRIKPGAR